MKKDTDKVKYITDFFKELVFKESTHEYFLNSNSVSISVSGIVHKFVIPFDIEGKSYSTAKKMCLSQEEIKEQWKKKAEDACTQGTKVHKFAEQYTFNRQHKPTDGYERAVVNFFKCLPEHIIPVAVEVKMYHKKYVFAGTCDTLLFNKITGNYILTDFKTNYDLFKNFARQKLLGCFSDLLENNFNKYQIQLSLYQLLFEQTGLKIEDRRIIHLKESGDFLIYKTEDYTERLQYYLENGYNRN